MSDLISRQAAIDALRDYLVGKRCPDDGMLICRLIENEVINKLPTAEVGTDLATKRDVKGFPIDADLLMLKVEEEYGFRARDRLYEIIRNMPKYDLPSAQPEPKRGKWIYQIGMIKCDQCLRAIRRIDHDGLLNFCPNCGADMRGEQDE